MTLDELILQLVNVGEKDPLTIARKVIERSEQEWLATELASLAEDIIAELARKQLGSKRRSAEVALRPGDQIARGDLELASAWIPGVGWKRAADLTAKDLRLRAGMYDTLATAAVRRAAWFREVAVLMEHEGAKTLGKLKAELPALPSDDVLELAAAMA